jgi:hypothetical protein
MTAFDCGLNPKRSLILVSGLIASLHIGARMSANEPFSACWQHHIQSDPASAPSAKAAARFEESKILM